MNNTTLKHNTMTVGELKRLLEGYDDEKLVFFAYNYADHWCTQVAANIFSATGEAVCYSDYHQMCRVIDGSSQPSPTDTTNVLILSSN